MPSLSTLLGGVALIAALAAGFEYTQVLQLERTIDDMKLAAKQAQIDQDAADAKLNDALSAAQREKVAAINAATAAAIKQVMNALPTSTCGPSVRDAARLLQRNGSPGPAAR